jgi:disulfide bond formation protein DsbB
VHVWRTDRDLQPALLGRWGTITGALALGDAERAMRAFSAILITIMCTVGGAPAPSEPTLGLVPLIQATACLDDTTRISLLDECFERIFQQHPPASSHPPQLQPTRRQCFWTPLLTR